MIREVVGWLTVMVMWLKPSRIVGVLLKWQINILKFGLLKLFAADSIAFI